MVPAEGHEVGGGGQEPATIRAAATAAERRACRMLLPNAAGGTCRSQLFVALAGDQGLVVGAAALGIDRLAETRREWRADLRVIVPFRGRGIGRALMQHVEAQARERGISTLFGWQWVEPDSDAARAWAALGFAPCRRRLEFEADLKLARATLLPMYERIVDDRWIPDTARIVPLAEADTDAVADLHVRYLGGSRALLRRLLRGEGESSGHFHPTYSRVLVVDGRVAGFTLGRVFPSDGVCEIDANVLHPAVRLGWANLWLKFEAASVLLGGGFHTLRYFSLDQHTDTRRVSRQVGARLVRTLVQMRHDLTTGHGPAGGACGDRA